MVQLVSVVLNPRMTLFSNASVIERVTASGNRAAVRLLEEKLAELPWALYRVRRIFHARGNASRQVRMVAWGSRHQMERRLRRIAPGRLSPGRWGILRWNSIPRPTEPAYPFPEEMYAVGPAQAENKERDGANFSRRMNLLRRRLNPG